MTKLTSQEIVDMNKEFTFFSWSVQGQVNPIPVEKADDAVRACQCAIAIKQAVIDLPAGPLPCNHAWVLTWKSDRR